MPTTHIRISISGCDDTTQIDLRVDEDELKFTKQLAELSLECSTYHCQPTISFTTIDDEDRLAAAHAKVNEALSTMQSEKGNE